MLPNFRVVGWGYYYLVTVMDDYSRFILAHRLQRDMTSDSFIEVVQEAVDRTGMDLVPIEDRTRLLSDNGPGYVSRAFRDYLGMVGVVHLPSSRFGGDESMDHTILFIVAKYVGVLPLSGGK